jgi:hypothetical protein
LLFWFRKYFYIYNEFSSKFRNATRQTSQKVTSTTYVWSACSPEYFMYFDLLVFVKNALIHVSSFALILISCNKDKNVEIVTKFTLVIQKSSDTKLYHYRRCETA